MEVAFVAQTETCTFLLDAEGICRFSVLRPDADKSTREAANRCLGAQYVASLDSKAEGLLVHEPKPGRSLLFARVSETGRVALVRSGPVLEFQALDPPVDHRDLHPPKSLAFADAPDESDEDVGQVLEGEERKEEKEDEGKPTEDFREVIRTEASAALDALEQTNELAAATDRDKEVERDLGEDDLEEEEEIELPLSAEIKLALDRLDDLPAMDASLPLDRPSSPMKLDDEVTVERPSAVPPPLSNSILGSLRGEELSQALPPTPPAPAESPENMLAKVMLQDDEGEELETLLVLDQHTEVETPENTDETTRFARIPIARGSEPITMKAPATLKGFPPPPKVSIAPRRGLLPRIQRS